MSEGWTPGIGDPTALGWATVAAYFCAALLAAQAAGRARKGARIERLFWLACCGVLIALGVNKQLDLQDLVTHVGRALAKAHGWYARRRHYQEEFILVIVVAAGLALLAFGIMLRRARREVRLALFGIIVTSGFVLIRAASFHHVDRWLKSGPLGARWNWILELTGIAIIALAAARYSRSGGKR